MYGFRARIGLMIPSSNNVMEPEFNAMKPDGVSVHVARLPHVAGSTIVDLKRMAKSTEEAADLLATAGVNIIAYGCTTGSLVEGVGWDQELISRIETVADIPATTTATAVIKTFKELGIGKVAVATPYDEEKDRLVKEFCEAHGIRVVRIKGLNVYGEDKHRLLPQVTYDLACQVNTPEADAVFISCTGFKSITVIEKIERDLNKYVFSSNTATMWDILRRLGISDRIEGLGKLFEN